MRHRTAWPIVALALGILAASLAAHAQQAKLPRVGLLWLGSGGPSPLLEALRQGLRERGYIEGQNLVLEDRSTVDHYTRLADVAAELVRLKVDVFVTWGATATQAAKKATGTIPIVMVAGLDPVETGLVASLARPGGNVTGLSTIAFDLYAKRLELLKEAFPGRSRVGVLLNPDSRSEVASLKRAEAAARWLGLQLQVVEVRRPEDLEKAFASMVQESAGALAPVPSTMLAAHRAQVIELAAKHRLPGIFTTKDYVEAGGLMSYGPDFKDLFRRAAIYVDKILKGAKPGDLPIEQPTKFELVINLKTAKTLGLTIPQSILIRADQVIQ